MKKAKAVGVGDAEVIEATSGRMSFAQLKAIKEEDRTKHFTKKNGKRLKLETKGKPSSKVSTWKIQIGIMINKDGSLRVKRGNNTTLPLTVAADISYNELLAKAVEKHDRFNEDVITNKEKEFYCLLYSDKTKAEFLPGSDERFNLQRYKEAPVYTTNVLGTTRLNFGTRTTTFWSVRFVYTLNFKWAIFSVSTPACEKRSA